MDVKTAREAVQASTVFRPCTACKAGMVVHLTLCAVLQAAGLALKKEDYTVRVPRSQRGGEIVEPLLREQWFVRMDPLAQPALQVPSLPPLLCLALLPLPAASCHADLHLAGPSMLCLVLLFLLHVQRLDGHVPCGACCCNGYIACLAGVLSWPAVPLSQQQAPAAHLQSCKCRQNRHMKWAIKPL